MTSAPRDTRPRGAAGGGGGDDGGDGGGAPPTEPLPELERRAHYERSAQLVLLAFAVLAAMVGFFVGARPDAVVRPGDADVSGSNAPVAPRYRDMRRSEGSATADTIARLSAHNPTLPPYGESVDPRLELREAAVAARAERRAYHGAPPTVPHPIEQRQDGACLTCHQHGLKLGTVVVPAMSHAPYSQCVQCHAVEPGPFPAGFPRLAEVMPENGFDGLDSPVRGSRAWLGAPPTIPHGTLMRSDCLSCHGPNGRDGLQTSHPWRSQCVQCHAADGALEQSPRSDLTAPRPFTLPTRVEPVSP